MKNDFINYEGPIHIASTEKKSNEKEYFIENVELQPHKFQSQEVV